MKHYNDDSAMHYADLAINRARRLKQKALDAQLDADAQLRIIISNTEDDKIKRKAQNQLNKLRQ